MHFYDELSMFSLKALLARLWRWVRTEARRSGGDGGGDAPSRGRHGVGMAGVLALTGLLRRTSQW